MIPEAIAIVCSPKYKNNGYFILSPKYGLQVIGNCKKSGFHEHTSTSELFEVPKFKLL
jgi:STAM-binding protein